MKRNILLELGKELELLDTKVVKLSKFIDTKNYRDLSMVSQLLLSSQLTAMATYINILVVRIALLKSEEEK